MAGDVVNVQQAKTHLSELLARAEQGDDITIARAGVPIVRLVLVSGRPRRTFGIMQFEVPDDFDRSMNDEELRDWE